MKYIRSDEEIQSIREACQVAATVLKRLVDTVEEGMTTYDLDQLGRKTIEELGAESACYGYRAGNHVFPAYTCLSVNEEIVHGIGTMRRTIQPGDVVSIDVVVRYRGYIGDNANTVLIEPVADANAALIEATRESLDYAIGFAKAGNRVGDISNAVERFIKRHNYGIVRDFVGHGVGTTMHEAPQIPNYGRRGSGALLKPGMCLAIEPMINMGTGKIEMLDDGWTAVTKDRKPSAHFEHTVLVTNGEPEILTIPQN
ncbi:type I methionyl aminopeptidase [Coraliomargarita sp. SDUM461003]|uniref:Methionine aminopeptidase n=1 Tax=Thalassobacterium maritimum TaxID=3041265 RepID=A0ABU1APH5_9BACT|nr:type I methionyl aminopeptidase [Coraliomargarita sp. SDUM461003]MBT64514.1 type I methionyl aminopeptidase [Puniceicoccaceae bacterium]MDQ8206056.1 type I methionyl aminopeptidase [Coraliomargarita sp. SDUM461003]HBR95491.1 type I methionyl aminopeptidase [Opitutae bacterium]|tara:strand:+ start:441 stop:1208 length:768 start_codon:yes stop_codon:yes gene_type:complete